MRERAIRWNTGNKKLSRPKSHSYLFPLVSDEGSLGLDWLLKRVIRTVNCLMILILDTTVVATLNSRNVRICSYDVNTLDWAPCSKKTNWGSIVTSWSGGPCSRWCVSVWGKFTLDDLWDTLKRCKHLGILHSPPKARFHKVVSTVDQLATGVTAALSLNCLS